MLTLYYHPLASFCWKALIALYENGTEFVPHLVDPGDPVSRAEFTKLWPIAKMPVLRDETRGQTIPESSIVIEYLAQHYPGAIPLIPADPELALRVRLADRIYDHYVHEPMQKIVLDRLRPSDGKDPHGVAAARAQLGTSYAVLDADMQGKTWAVGEAFTLADCAAAPALFYANKVVPFGDTHPNLAAYLDRLMQRPSFARVLAEAEPSHFFPQAD